MNTHFMVVIILTLYNIFTFAAGICKLAHHAPQTNMSHILALPIISSLAYHICDSSIISDIFKYQITQYSTGAECLSNGIMAGSESNTGGSESNTGGSESNTGGSESNTGGSESHTGGSESKTGGSESNTGGSERMVGAS